MAKQIYIDSNGNEIQVSGTVNTAEMMPMSGNDSTKVATAIGDLSQLTTTDKSSLVGAVKEVNGKAVKSTSAKPLFKIVQTSSISVTINANSYATITANDIYNNIVGSMPSGYKIVAIHRFYQTDDSCYLLGYDLSATGSNAFTYIKNPTATAKTRNVVFYFLAINSDYI